MSLSKRELTAYALEFSSFLLQSEIGENIERIILFGSVARGDFDKESDIDIFVDTKKNIETAIAKTLKAFEFSAITEKWRLKGLTNPLSVKSGELTKWKLHRDIISNGILLYGAFAELPKGARYLTLLRLDFSKLKRAEKAVVWRSLYGYTQKVGKKAYASQGFIEELGGRKIEKSVIVIPSGKRSQMLEFLRSKKIGYRIDDLWSDTL